MQSQKYATNILYLNSKADARFLGSTCKNKISQVTINNVFKDSIKYTDILIRIAHQRLR